MAKSPNIGVQRMSPRATADAGSFGGRLGVACGVIGVFLTAALTFGQVDAADATLREERIATLQLSPGMCVDNCESWSIALLGDGSAFVSIGRQNVRRWSGILPAGNFRYQVSAGNSTVRELTTLVEGLDPEIPPPIFLLHSASFEVVCEPPGSLHIDHPLESDGPGSPLGAIRNLAGQLVEHLENGEGGEPR